VNKTEFLRNFEQGPLLFDGAMGTCYAALSGNLTERCEVANRTNPELIRRILGDYIDAGCRAIKTNTFGIGPIAAEFGREEAFDLTDRAWAIAQEAVDGRDIAIFADFGPPTGEDADWEAIYLDLANHFLSLGARFFLFETFPDDALIRAVAAHLRTREPDVYIVASFAVFPDGFTGAGLFGKDLAERLYDDGLADAVGFNCVSGPGHLLRLVEEMDTARYPLTIMPNAGYPTTVGGRTIYGNNPTYFADRMREMAARGVKLLGGCCGTDADYIRETARALYGERITPISAVPKAAEAAKSQRENRFRDKLMRGERVFAVEFDSPLDSDIERYMAGAAELKAAGADIITIADCPVARSRMDSSIVACKVHRELGIDTLPHLTCRDRNLNATRALLLGLSAEGVHNVLIVTGDPIPTAERDVVKSVYNFNSRMLARYIRQLSSDVFRTPFCIGGALNVNATNFDAQLRLAREKVECGIEMLFTQPIMTPRGAENLRRAKRELDVKILGGIMPIVSHRNAQFISSELQGMDISAETVELFLDKSKEECARLGIELALEMAERIAGDIDGYYLITPFSRTDMIVEILGKLR